MTNIVINNESLKGFLDIKSMSFKNIRKNGYFAIKIDLNKIDISKKTIRKILRLRVKVLKNKNIKNDLNGIAFSIYNYIEKREEHRLFVDALKAILKIINVEQK